jgi:hypothetical protein
MPTTVTVNVDPDRASISQVLQFLQENGFEYKVKTIYIKKPFQIIPRIHGSSLRFPPFDYRAEENKRLRSKATALTKLLPKEIIEVCLNYVLNII